MLRSLAATSLFALACTVVAAPARADESSARAEARAHFQQGLVHAREGEYTDAVASFEQAYATSPNYAVLYNLGQAYVVLGRAVEAVHTFERFLAEGADQIEPERRREVEALLERERARLGRLELQIEPAGAEVFLDGKRLGTAPVAPEDVLAGEHVAAAQLTGYLPMVQWTQVEPGGAFHLKLQLKPELLLASPHPVTESDRARLPAAPPLPEHAGTRRAWMIGLGSTGVALAGAAIVTYVWNSHRYDAWELQRNAYDAKVANGNGGSQLVRDSSALTGRAANIQRADDLAIGFAVVAGAALVSAGILWLTTPRSPRAPAYARP